MKKVGIVILIIFVAFVCSALYGFYTKDYREKKELGEKDEASYGEDYAEFKSDVYKERPERIVVKKQNTKNEFYVFDKNHKEYEHLLKVTLDRMHYAYNEDFNLTKFAPSSLDDISNSDENIVVFDYNDDVSEKQYMFENDFNRDIFIRFSNNTRLFRLVDFLTCKAKKYSIEELRNTIGKAEFVPLGQIVSGYKYMHPNFYMD